MKVLETKRLILRNFYEKDVYDFYQFAKNHNVTNSAGWKPHNSIEESERLINRFIEDDNVWAIVWKENNKVIGCITFKDDIKRLVNDAKMIGYSLCEEYWGKGIMTEAVNQVLEYAFQEMCVVSVAAYHFYFNQRSKRVLDKCGFVFESKLRCSYEMYNGEILDEYCYSILREEYLLKHLLK
ncbi:GNAT family protein [Paludicola sp. MB14-C6]|uniref:GNAT family N-acetyltransferase n=1 Tax=Paludihabitans sp. MB14-C6 TaxID=3070656 RepID=UPI0027DDA466|nr:GNAT family protein [Paludicola sp. MB14-C6]WMJ23320.1 GNAT family protein [Paludicola sp. MB14-C6]